MTSEEPPLSPVQQRVVDLLQSIVAGISIAAIDWSWGTVTGFDDIYPSLCGDGVLRPARYPNDCPDGLFQLLLHAPVKGSG